MGRSRYPRGYREDEEMYVYDQSCSNCALFGGCCPLDEDSKKTKAERIRAAKLKEEDGVSDGSGITWCIHWKSEKGFRF